MAEDLGDQDKAKQIQDQLNELEERAEARKAAYCAIWW